MTIIVTRPQHDLTTRYISSWAIDIIDRARKKGYTFVDLQKEKANKKEFEGRVKKIHPRMVFLNGHGSSDCVMGHDNEMLIKAGENHQLLSQSITYAVSCASGKKLGPNVAESGQSAYIGFTDDFIFSANMKYSTRPLEDPIAKPFMECSNKVMSSLLKGHTANEATERSRDFYHKQYTRLSSSTADPDALQAAQLLWWNMRNLTCCGNGEMSF